jgi:hypothetical protein
MFWKTADIFLITGKGPGFQFVFWAVIGDVRAVYVEF